MATPAEAASA